MSLGDRLADFDINVARSLSNSSASWQNSSELCVYHEGAVAQGATEALVCSQPIVGRYVTVVLPTDQHALTLCEVQVLATPKNLGGC